MTGADAEGDIPGTYYLELGDLLGHMAKMKVDHHVMPENMLGF